MLASEVVIDDVRNDMKNESCAVWIYCLNRFAVANLCAGQYSHSTMVRPPSLNRFCCLGCSRQYLSETYFCKHICIFDKILKSLAIGTKTVTSLYSNTTAQYGGCNQTSNSQSQLNHLLRQIAHPVNTDSCNVNRQPSSLDKIAHNNFRH